MTIAAVPQVVMPHSIIIELTLPSFQSVPQWLYLDAFLLDIIMDNAGGCFCLYA